MNRKDYQVPPGLKGQFLLGNLPQLLRNPLNFFTRSTRELGGITSISLPIGRCYLVADPELIEQILVTQQRNYAKPRFYKTFSSLLGNGLALSNGDFWLRQRRLSQPAFHQKRIHSYGEVMVAYTNRMLAKWQDGELLNIDPFMHQLTMENITKILFDADIAATSGALGHEFKIVLAEIQARLLNPFQIPSFIPTPRNKRYRQSIKNLEKLIYNIADERRASGKDTGDLLSMYLHAQDEDGKGMTNVQLRDEMMTLILGGHETTANALSWTWYLLSTNPEAEKKLWQELDSVLAGKLPTLADLPKLRYTEMVVKEALRLFPPAWFFGREAIKDCTLGGYTIPAGKQFFLTPWAVHRNPQFFPEPDQFEPERWASEETKNLPKFAYFPFGGGPRVCIGNALAMMEATLIVATIAQKYQLKLEPGQKIEPQPLVTLRPKHGLKMRLVARKPTLLHEKLAATAQTDERNLAVAH